MSFCNFAYQPNGRHLEKLGNVRGKGDLLETAYFRAKVLSEAHASDRFRMSFGRTVAPVESETDPLSQLAKSSVMNEAVFAQQRRRRGQGHVVDIAPEPVMSLPEIHETHTIHRTWNIADPAINSWKAQVLEHHPQRPWIHPSQGLPSFASSSPPVARPASSASQHHMELPPPSAMHSYSPHIDSMGHARSNESFSNKNGTLAPLGITPAISATDQIMPSSRAAAAATAAADASGDADSTAHFKDVFKEKDGLKDARPGTSFSARNNAKLLAYVDRPRTSSQAADVAGVAESRLAAKIENHLAEHFGGDDGRRAATPAMGKHRSPAAAAAAAAASSPLERIREDEEEVSSPDVTAKLEAVQRELSEERARREQMQAQLQELLQKQQQGLMAQQVEALNARLKQLSKGHPLCMPAAASAVPVAGGFALPSLDIATTLAKKTIDAAISGSAPPKVAPRLKTASHHHPADAIFAANNLAPKLSDLSPSPTRLKKSSRMGPLPPPTPIAGLKGDKFGILADLEGTVYSSRLSVMVKDAHAKGGGGGGGGSASKKFFEKPEGYLGGSGSASMSVQGLMQKAKSLQSELHRIGVIDMSVDAIKRRAQGVEKQSS